MFIAIEGIDGAGKRTQAELLRAKVQEAGRRADIISFPRYGQTLFARSIADYLNGKFGDLASVPAQFAALLYAGDRFESLALIKRLLQNNDVLICDRYVASNLAYQTAKSPQEHWQEFVEWVAQIEYDIYDLPKADLTLYLDIVPALAQGQVYKKEQRDYTMQATDLHESNTQYLSRCREVYQRLAAANFGGTWVTIQSVNASGTIRSIEEIHEDIWRSVQKNQ